MLSGALEVPPDKALQEALVNSGCRILQLPGTGGDYSAAAADLLVLASGCQVPLQLAPAGGNRFQLAFPPCAGRNHFVEFVVGLAEPRVWQVLPDAPHNTGLLFVTNVPPAGSFYRVRVQ